MTTDHLIIERDAAEGIVEEVLADELSGLLMSSDPGDVDFGPLASAIVAALWKRDWRPVDEWRWAATYKRHEAPPVPLPQGETYAREWMAERLAAGLNGMKLQRRPVGAWEDAGPAEG